MSPITIDRVELRYAKLRLARPFRTSFGVERERDVILVAIHGEGLVGWGECVPMDFPGYSYETAETVWHILKAFLVPVVLAEPAESPNHVASHWTHIRGHPMAKAGVEGALWDLFAQAEKVPLADYLWKEGGYEGRRPDRVPVGVSTGIQSTMEGTLELIEERLELGYRRIKVKIEPGWDVSVVAAIRERFPDIQLMADANSAYTLDDADTLRELDVFGLMMIEQPLYDDDIYLHGKLQRELKTPICLDESIHHVRDAEHALDIGACGNINIKPGRVGGLGEGQRIHDLCHKRGVSVWCGGMLESGVGRAANVAIATLPGYTLPSDISASDRYFKRDIITEPFVLNAEDSTMSVPGGPGIGVTVDMDFLETLLVRQADLRKD
jgi:O-succinylbenzoate synthase